MAHEQLRFPLVLNRKKSSNSDDFAYEPVYSDMEYGTHYSIYADFIGEVINSKDSYFSLNRIDFRIQNFSGSVTMGLSKIIGIREKDLNPNWLIEDFSTGRVHKIYVLLQALNNNKTATFPEICNGKIQEQEVKQLNLKISQGDVIEVKVYYEPIDEKYSQIFQDPEIRNEKCLFVDPIYMVRDGEDIYLQKDAKKRSKIIEALKGDKWEEAIERAKSVEVNPSFIELNEIEDDDDNVFGAIGRTRPCKMKLSDVYIL